MSSFHVKLSDVTVKDRGRKEYKDVPALAESLREFGQIQNITVRRPREDEAVETPWVLVTGGRRFAAATMIGLEELRAEALEDMPHWKQIAVELEENIQRSDMQFYEVAEMKMRIHELYSGVAKAEGKEWTQQDTAKVIGETPANLSRDLKLAKALREDPSLKNATSKKAAVRAVEMKEHVRVLAAQKDTVDLASVEGRIEIADMRDYLAKQATGSVDLLFSDLPFGIDYYEAPSDGRGGISTYDDSKVTTLKLIRDVAPEFIRVTRKTGWMVFIMNWECHFELKEALETCCAIHYEYGDVEPYLDEFGFVRKRVSKRCRAADKLLHEGNCEYLKTEDLPWIWHRPNSRNNPLHPDLHAQNQYELMLVLNRGWGKILTPERCSNVLVFDTDYENRVHAMQKPDELCEEVIRRLTIAGQRVVDVCHGSGSGLRAARKLGRDYGGCDLNPALHDLAVGYVARVVGGPADKNGAMSDAGMDGLEDLDEESEELAEL